MLTKTCSYALAVVCSLIMTSVARADLPEAIESAMAGNGGQTDQRVQTITVGRHGFYIRPFTVESTGEGATVDGFFRHRHRGKDDRIYYSIRATKDSYTATLTRVEFRGLFSSGKVVNMGVLVTGAQFGPEGGLSAAGAFKLLGKLQTKLDGNWLPEAAQIVDAIGSRVHQKVKTGN